MARRVLRRVSAPSTPHSEPSPTPQFVPSGSHWDASISDLEIPQSPFFEAEWAILWLNAKAKLRRNTGDN